MSARDTDGLRELITLTQSRLRAIAFRLLNDLSEVDEIVQDVYLTVWDKAAKYDPGRAHGMAWLTVITRNRCLDRLRSRASRQHLGPDATDLLVATGSEHDVAERDEQLEKLTVSLEILEPSTRDAIKAAFFDGHTYEALAKTHNVPLGTMKSRIRRGLLALRSALRS